MKKKWQELLHQMKILVIKLEQLKEEIIKGVDDEDL